MAQITPAQVQQLRAQAMFKHNQFEEKRIKHQEKHSERAIKGLEGVLVVHLLEAKHLSASDMGGKSDPYAVLKVGKQKFKSKVQKKTLEPQWNEQFMFKVKDDERLTVKVKDHDRLTHDDSLGNVKLDLKYFSSGTPQDSWYDLSGKGSVHLRVQFLSCKLEGKLVVRIVEAKDLPSADLLGKSDPYVVCNVGKHHQRTKKVKHTLNPKWNQEFTFDLSGEMTIYFQVMDWDRFTRDDKIGSVVLKFKHWLPFFEQGLGVDDWFGLHKKGSLHLQFHFVPDTVVPHAMPREYDTIKLSRHKKK